MPVDNIMTGYSHRLSSKFLSPVAICGCGSNTVEESLKCCQVADLGIVYELEPVYNEETTPCSPSRNDGIVDGECITTPDAPPYGTISETYHRACAKLIIWEQAIISGNSFNFSSEKILYSRQRKNLPKLNGIFCENPIYCPPINGLSSCCENASFPVVGGPYLNCPIKRVPFVEETCFVDCNSNFKDQILKFGMSNCEIEYEDLDLELQRSILAGYAIDENNWWFTESPEFGSVLNSIKQTNPHGPISQTIYAHFQVEWKGILCNQNGGIPSAPCNGAGQINMREGKCGDGNLWGLTNKEEREKSVRIKAAIGYSLGDCGYTPEEACDKIYQ